MVIPVFFEMYEMNGEDSLEGETQTGDTHSRSLDSGRNL